MHKKIFGVVLILLVMASILTVSTASDYSKGNLISYDTASKKVEVFKNENIKTDDNLDVENEINKIKDIKKQEVNDPKITTKEESSKTNENGDKVQPSLKSQTKDKPESKSQPKPEPKPQPKPEPKPQPKPEPKPQPKPEPKPQPKPQPKPEPKPQPKPTTPVSSSKQYEIEVIRLVNIERQKVGLGNLTESSKLANVAIYKSQDMINKNYFSHTSPTYGSPFNMMKKFGISYNFAGENIAAGQANPQAVVNAWMNSPGHKDNILNKNFTQIGIGYIKDKNNYPFWTQMFIGSK